MDASSNNNIFAKKTGFLSMIVSVNCYSYRIDLAG